jgi:hypothetical protein
LFRIGALNSALFERKKSKLIKRKLIFIGLGVQIGVIVELKRQGLGRRDIFCALRRMIVPP